MMPDPLVALTAAALISGVGFVMFRPERGVISRWQQARRMSERVRTEDAIKYIHKCEMKGQGPTVESIAGVLNLGLDETTELLERIQANGLLQLEEDAIRLSAKGRQSALHIIRAHRLWERYLAEETGFDEAEWHGRAEQFEHLMTPAQADELAYHLGNPTYDPHGDPIPTAEGEIVSHGGQSLTSLPIDQPAKIVHLEDEPEVVYAQLMAEGLHLGMVIRVVESTPERIRFWADGDEHLLAPIVAMNISVLPLTKEVTAEPTEGDHLGMLHLGETAEVTGISAACRGGERRRFLDLGILPGTKISAEMRSPGGDPTAYKIRGALIALRQDQAKLIKIQKSRNGHE